MVRTPTNTKREWSRLRTYATLSLVAVATVGLLGCSTGDEGALSESSDYQGQSIDFALKVNPVVGNYRGPLANVLPNVSLESVVFEANAADRPGWRKFFGRSSKGTVEGTYGDIVVRQIRGNVSYGSFSLAVGGQTHKLLFERKVEFGGVSDTLQVSVEADGNPELKVDRLTRVLSFLTATAVPEVDCPHQLPDPKEGMPSFCSVSPWQKRREGCFVSVVCTKRALGESCGYELFKDTWTRAQTYSGPATAEKPVSLASPFPSEWIDAAGPDCADPTNVCVYSGEDNDTSKDNALSSVYQLGRAPKCRKLQREERTPCGKGTSDPVCKISSEAVRAPGDTQALPLQCEYKNGPNNLGECKYIPPTPEH